MLKDQQYTDKGALLPFLKRIFHYAMQYRLWFWTFIVGVVIVGIVDAVYPLIWMHYLDSAIMPAVEVYKQSWDKGITPSIDYQGLWFYGGLFLLNGLLQLIGVFVFVKLGGYMEENVMYRLRKEMFSRLQELSFSYYDKSASGWLLSRISSDTKRVTVLISWGFLEVIWGITMIIACLGAMFYYNWKLALIVAAAIPFLMIVSIKIRMLILKYSREARKINSELTANFNEHINGVAVNKMTSQEQRVSGEFKGLSDNMRRSSYRAAYYTAMYFPLVVFTGSIAAAFVLYAGGWMAIGQDSQITVGILAAFFSYATLIFLPIMDISRFYAMAQGCISAGERIFSLIDEVPEIKDREGATDFGIIQGNIEFENVDFAYVEDKMVYENLNLSIKAGQSIALVGATGGGKSTITNLVGRFYEPTKGTLKIDGEDYLHKTLHSLRSQLGVVLQTPHLFSGTLRDNIKYGRLTATDEEIKQTLQMVGAAHFISRLDEEVGEAGDKLSIGEKQLISFARALLSNPRILVMDEATSSIDTLTEAKIQKGIAQMIAGRTSIIIAHRLSTIKNCDRILVIKNGQILEDGSHKELLQQKGYYYDLYTKQVAKKTERKLAV